MPVQQENKSETAALSAQEVESRYGVDLTAAEVIRHALRYISLQMQLKINAGALSPMLNEVNDFGIGLLGPRIEERNLDFDAIAMSTGAPAHFVINQYYARMAIEHWGAEKFEPGDVVIFNDPFRGGSHVNDIGAVMPIFDDGELLGFAASITHWLDIGGPIPSGFGAGLQHDMYAEGIRLSPRLLYKGGELVRETVELFTEQTRIADISANDLQVIKAAQPSVDDFKLMALLAHSGDCMYRALADLAPHAHDAELLRETAREQVVQAERMRRAVELLLGEPQPPLCATENPYYRVPEGSFEPHLIKSVAKAEQKSRRTYLTWADAVGRADVAALCRQNADEEVAHAERLLSILAGFGRTSALTPSNGLRILFVLTSHDRKGDKPSGYYLSEVTHPHKLLSEAGYQIDFVSPAGGKPPVDPDSFHLDDPINAAFWNDPARREAIEHTRRPMIKRYIAENVH